MKIKALIAAVVVYLDLCAVALVRVVRPPRAPGNRRVCCYGVVFLVGMAWRNEAAHVGANRLLDGHSVCPLLDRVGSGRP